MPGSWIPVPALWSLLRIWVGATWKLVQFFFNQFNVTVLVENEANVRPGEYRYGAAKVFQPYLSQRRLGMGGGILIDGQLFSGSQGLPVKLGIWSSKLMACLCLR